MSQTKWLATFFAVVLAGWAPGCGGGSSGQPDETSSAGAGTGVTNVGTAPDSGTDGAAAGPQGGPAAAPASTPVAPPITPPPPPAATPPVTAAGRGALCGAGCAVWGAPVPHGALPASLPELSGLASSRVHPGLLYTHNDSGDTAHFFAMDENATVRAEMRLPGATAYDWEDIAVGPCPSGSCVYIGDTGDNAAVRDQYTIYRVAEPDRFVTDASAMSVGYEAFHFLYPDDTGRHNAEALLVHPQSGRVFVIIKMGGRPAVYEMAQPLVAGQQQTLVKVATLLLPVDDSIVTGGDFHPCGDRMLVRTVQSLYELSAPGKGVEALFATTPVKVPVAAEPQGEAVTYSLDGRRYFTSSETGAQPQPLNIVSCQSP